LFADLKGGEKRDRNMRGGPKGGVGRPGVARNPSSDQGGENLKAKNPRGKRKGVPGGI